MSAEMAGGRNAGEHSQTARAFVARLRQRVEHVSAKTPLPQQPVTALRAVGNDEDLAARFVAAAEAAGCGTYRASKESWPTVVRDILRGRSARRVVVEPQAGTALGAERAAALNATLAESQISGVAERGDETLFAVDAAITGVHAAVAETGTIVCVSSGSSARGTSLIPPLHVALVAQSQIVADLFDAFAQLSARPSLPANVNLITGPSKTADIEGVLVTGVHGPGEVHIIVLGGEGEGPAEPQRVA